MGQNHVSEIAGHAHNHFRTPDNTSLCPKCQSISAVPPGNTWTACYKHDDKTLRKAVRAKCYICTHLWNSFSKEQKKVAKSERFMGLTCKVLLFTGETDLVQGSLMFEYGDDLYNVDDFSEVWPGAWFLNPKMLSTVDQLSSSTKNESCWTLTRQWIDQCSSSHKTCSESNPQWVPTRLLDITDYRKTGKVRLVTTSGIPGISGEHYVALSHCWGKKEFWVMGQHNKEQFEHGVSVKKLCRNFRNAVYVTSKLGLRYIWIDSLCIIQGSEQDWNAEAPLMNQVYTNAFITLAAMASNDGYGGLFRRRNPDLVKPCKFRPTFDTGAKDCLLIPQDFWQTAMETAPLNQRAWVLQERLLAPRTLYFCETQLFWECRELTSCEVLEHVPKEIQLGTSHMEEDDVVGIKAWACAVEHVLPTHGSGDVQADSGTGQIPVRQYETPYEVWGSLLDIYVKCALTKPYDKFVAIAGLAKEFGKLVEDEYLAGLWRKNLINGLLWHVGDLTLFPLQPSTRPQEYRAPSWSWAAVDAPGTTRYACEPDFQGEYAEVVEVDVEPVGEDRTGQLKDAYIRLQAFVIKLPEKPSFSATFAASHCFGIFYPDVEGEIEDEDLFCIPLRELHIPGSTPIVDLVGLVVTPCSGEEDEAYAHFSCAAYKRVGYFRISKGEPLDRLGQLKP